MPIVSRLKAVVDNQPVGVGRPAPKLSLTADEGTWIRLEDFREHIHAVLIFFRSMRDDATDAWLKDYQRLRPRFEELETAIFGVNTARTDKLREFRNSLGLEYYLLYDPLGIDSRGFNAASRWRPSCKDTVVLVGKDGQVHFSERGQVPAWRLLEVVARLEGADLPTEAESSAKTEFTGVRDPGKAAARVKSVGSQQAAAMLGETDSLYVLLDVRTPSEFEADHAKGAVLIPLDELPHRYQELGQTTHIICIGQVGNRSAAAAEFLTSIGCSEIYNVEDGMTAWSGSRVTGGHTA